MKFLTLISALAATSTVSAAAIEKLYTLEFAPGVTKQVTEEGKLDYIKAGTHFMDITEFADLEGASDFRIAATFPSAVSQQTAIKPLLTKLTTTTMKTNLQGFSSFNNRYYKATTGRTSAEWLYTQIKSVIAASGASGASVKFFNNTFVQPNIIATIPGKSTRTVAIGAHLDSVNGASPSTGKSQGADDDGSGSVTILEALRVLLTSSTIASGQAANTLEFHWYAGEEGGLLGSQALFSSYKTAGRNVWAMLQQDMTGYTQGTINAGKVESVGVITDYVDTGLTNFIKKVITAYCTIPYVETKCGYACSDHASASKAGYASAFVIEAAFENTNKQIHTASDTIDKVNFNHMLEHAKMTLGFAYELALSTVA